MADLLVGGANGAFATIKDAVAASQAGDVIRIAAGTYVNDFSKITHALTIIGEGEVKLVATGLIDEVDPTPKAPNSTTKAFFDVAAEVGDEVLIEHIAMTGAGNKYTSGSAIRFDWNNVGDGGCNLTVRDCVITDCQMGILGTDDMWTGGSITVEGCVFESNGLDRGSSYNHAIYIGTCDELVVKDCTFNGTRDGNHIKSRAAKTVVDGCHLYANGNNDAKSINVPGGGDVTIVNNVMEKGPLAGNLVFIDYGDPNDFPYKNGAPLIWAGQAIVENNIFISDKLSALGVRNGTIDLAQWAGAVPPASAWNPVSLVNNTFYGLDPSRHVDSVLLNSYNKALGPVAEAGSVDFGATSEYGLSSPDPLKTAAGPLWASATIVGTAQDDTISYVGLRQTALAGDGNDAVRYSAGAALIDGGGNGAAGDTLVLVHGAVIDLASADQTLLDGATVTGFENVDASRSAVRVIVSGTAGANVLAGGRGDDILAGGAGEDTFVIGPRGGADTILDFEPGDRIDLTGLEDVLTFAALMDLAVEVPNAAGGTDAVFTLGPKGTLTLRNVLKSQLSADAFVFGLGPKATGSVSAGTAAADVIGPQQFTPGMAVLAKGGDDVVAYSLVPERLDGGDSGRLGDTLVVASGVHWIDLSTDDQTGFDTVSVSGFENVDARAATRALRLEGNARANILRGGSNLTGFASGAPADVIVGEEGDDLIEGGAGDDKLYGGAGRDLFVFKPGSGNDRVFDFKPEDRIDLAAYGFTTLAQVLAATSDAPDDTYDGLTEAKIALPGGGVLTLQNVEKDSLTASQFLLSGGTILGSAGGGSASVYGSEGADGILALGAGDLVLAHGGNDTVMFNPAAERVDGGDGSDTLNLVKVTAIDLSRADQTLGDAAWVQGFETVNAASAAGPISFRGDAARNGFVGSRYKDVALGAGGNDRLEGRAGRDKLYGGDGADMLSGGLERDTLSGGRGRDIFLFDSKLKGTTNVDTIIDFRVVDDTIRLENAVFRKVGPGSAAAPKRLSAEAFAIGPAAADPSDRIIYDKNRGILYYDPDGTGGAAQIKFAILKSGLSLTYADFVIV